MSKKGLFGVSLYRGAIKKKTSQGKRKKMIKIDIITPSPTHQTTTKSKNCMSFIRRVCQISPS